TPPLLLHVHPPLPPPPLPSFPTRRSSDLRPAPDLDALDQPALTGLPPGGAAALAAGLALPHAARRQARLHAKRRGRPRKRADKRSEEHTSELQSRENLVCRLLLEKKKQRN